MLSGRRTFTLGGLSKQMVSLNNSTIMMGNVHAIV